MTYRLAIKSAEDFHLPDPRWAGATVAERIVLAHWHMETDGHHVTVPRMVSNKATAWAFVNHGRWCVRCPWCPSAQNAARSDHRFFCVECGNAAVRGAWVPVIWPEDDEIVTIESLLGARPTPANQNWSPGEATAQLAAENVEHGVV